MGIWCVIFIFFKNSLNNLNKNYLLYKLIYTIIHYRILVDNWEEHQEVGDRYAAALSTLNGREYTVGNSNILLYTTYGSSADYMAHVGVPLSYTIELTGGPGTGFILPIEMLQGVLDENWLGFHEFANYVQNHDWDD